jgi:hypothetical protein
MPRHLAAPLLTWSYGYQVSHPLCYSHLCTEHVYQRSTHSTQNTNSTEKIGNMILYIQTENPIKRSKNTKQFCYQINRFQCTNS